MRYVEVTFGDGVWGEISVVDSNKIEISCFSTALNYAQSAFEGMKAIYMKDGIVRVVTPELHYDRLIKSCGPLGLGIPPRDLFFRMVKRALDENMEHVPKCGSDEFLYIRPLIFGDSGTLNVVLSPTSKFLVCCTTSTKMFGVVKPDTPMGAVIRHHHDRAATWGTGQLKIGANYARSLEDHAMDEAEGYGISMYLDPAEGKYVDEFATSNFVGLIAPTGENSECVYVTPRSYTILPSISNINLSRVAVSRLKWKVEHRRVEWQEVKDGCFSEIGAIGTALCVKPVSHIVRETVPESKVIQPIEPVYGCVKPLYYTSSEDVHKEKVPLGGYLEGSPLITKLKQSYLSILTGVDPDLEEGPLMRDMNDLVADSGTGGVYFAASQR